MFKRAAERAGGRRGRAAWGVLLGALALVSTGCVARAGMRGGVVYQPPSIEIETVPVEVQAVPVEVEAYPSYAYGGANVYLVDGRWYRRHGGNWVVYRREPRALASVRVSYEAKYGRGYRPQHKPDRHPPQRGPKDHHDRR